MNDAPKWKSFEDAVAQIQGLFTPKAKITKNARIKDRLGHTREFDVLIEDTWGGHDLLAVIECKDLQGKVGTPQVEAFKEKSDKVRANFRAIVSRKGFSKPALEAAEHYGIGALSLLPEDGEIARLAVYVSAEADVWKWGKARLRLILAGRSTPQDQNDVFTIQYEGRSVFAWFIALLRKDHAKIKTPGLLRFGVRFHEATELTIGGTPHLISHMWLFVERLHLRKQRKLKLTGDAFYDWHSKRLCWPGGGALVSETIDMYDLENWDDRDEGSPGELVNGLSLSRLKLESHQELPDFGVEPAHITSDMWEPILEDRLCGTPERHPMS